MKDKLKVVASQPSWTLKSGDVKLSVTRLGGHMAPVTFYRHSKSPVSPYYISPWQDEGLEIDDPVLVPLRGDFFCAPFGANAVPYHGEKHPCHGEPAYAKWAFRGAGRSGGVSSLTLSMKTKIRPGKVTKTLSLVSGQNVVYSSNVMSGYSGRLSIGHHPCLAMPEKERSVRIATSPIRFGRTNPGPVGVPADRAYQAITSGKRFKSLKRVGLVWADDRYDDLTEFPARPGFTDLIGVFNKPSARPGWTTAVFEDGRFLWFSLKDISVLPTTLLWISNRGRHQLPWNGRNCCLGLEDVCGYFADGIAPSARANDLSAEGIATSVKLSPKTPTVVNYIQGVAKTPRGFKQVRTVKFSKGCVTFVSVTGMSVSAEVHWDFLQKGCID